jgi:hypothetical protein
MPNITAQRTSRRTAMSLALAVTAALAVPAAALAADAPTLGVPTIIPAGQQTPIDVGGNHLHQHDVIRQGTELVRWPVVMHGKSKAVITLSCPTGTIHTGLGLQEGSDVAFGVAESSRYFARTIKVRFYTAPKVDPNGARGHVYALCRDTSIAPMAPAVGNPTSWKAGRKSPVVVAGQHLHRGDTIRRGTQLERYPVTMRGASKAAVTLVCPRGMVHRGLAFGEGSKLDAHLAKGSHYGHNTLDVRIHTRDAKAPDTQAGSIYALCGS